MRAQRFNLVEIVIALGIVAIGVTAVMGFLPMGLNASRDAIADNYAADSSDQLLHYLSSTFQGEWNELGNIHTQPADISDVDMDLTVPESAHTWQHITGTNMYKILLEPCPSCPLERAYRILQQTDDIAGVGTTIVDFDAMVRIWKTPTAAWEYDGSAWVTTIDSNYDKRALLNIEMSWPATVNFGARRKAYYALEVNKP